MGLMSAPPPAPGRRRRLFAETRGAGRVFGAGCRIDVVFFPP
jgi:hypothetical protein